MLGERVPGCRFLDLFAGSGAVGIEAWSRGASFVCWVEIQPRVCSLLEENVESLCDGRTRILRWNAEQLLKKGLDEEPFHIIFADPPYQKGSQNLASRGSQWPRADELDEAELDADEDALEERGRGRGRGGADLYRGGWEGRLVRALSEGRMLANGGLLVVELSSREKLTDHAGWEIVNDRVYGDARLRILRRTV